MDSYIVRLNTLFLNLYIGRTLEHIRHSVQGIGIESWKTNGITEFLAWITYMKRSKNLGITKLLRI